MDYPSLRHCKDKPQNLKLDPAIHPPLLRSHTLRAQAPDFRRNSSFGQQRLGYPPKRHRSAIWNARLPSVPDDPRRWRAQHRRVANTEVLVGIKLISNGSQYRLSGEVQI